MAPTLNEGDWVVVRWRPRRKKLEVGNIVVIERDDQPGIQYIKRITKLRKNGFGLKVTTLNQVSILEVGVFLPVKRLLENFYLDIGKEDNF